MVKDILVFLLGLFFVIIFSLSTHPLGLFFENSFKLISLFRIAFGLLLLVRLLRTYKALPLLFSYSSFQKPNLLFPKGIYYLQVFFSICLIIGIFTDITAAIVFFLNILIFQKAKYYSIEDIYFQNNLFHLPFLASGYYFSFDSIIGYSSLLSSSEFFNSFFISNGLIMFSAGYEKLKSAMWLSGKGACSFLSLPHLVKKQFHFLVQKFNSLFVIGGFVIIASEFLLLPSAVNNYFLLVVLLVLIIFSIFLFVVVDISFIGQILLLNYLFIGVVLLFNWNDYYFSLANIDFKWSGAGVIVLLLNVLTLITIVFYQLGKRLKLDKIQKILTGVNSPIGVFNEKHLFGFYTYRLFYLDGNQKEVSVLEAFDENGYPGPLQLFYPRYFQGAIYPVTDFCLGIHKYGKDSKFKEGQMVDLLFAGMNSVGNKIGSIALSVKKYDFDETVETYKSQKWITILECEFNGSNYHLKRINQPPILKKTCREV